MIDEVPLGTSLLISALTHNPATMLYVNADSVPTYDVFKGVSDTPVLAAQTMVARASQIGVYRALAALSSGNGFAIGDQVQILVTAIVGGGGAHKMYECRIIPADITAGYKQVELALIPPTSAVIAARVFDETMAGHTTAGTFGDKMRVSLATMLKLVVAAGGSTTTIPLNTSTGVEGGAPVAVNTFYSGAAVVFLTGALVGQRVTVTGYDGSTKTLTVSAMTQAPGAGDLALLV